MLEDSPSPSSRLFSGERVGNDARHSLQVSLILHVARSSSPGHSRPHHLHRLCRIVLWAVPATSRSAASPRRGCGSYPALTRRSRCSNHCMERSRTGGGSGNVLPAGLSRLRSPFLCPHAGRRRLEAARRVAARYPQRPGKVSLHRRTWYINAKVASMETMEAAATTDIVVISTATSASRLTTSAPSLSLLPTHMSAALPVPIAACDRRRIVGALGGRGHERGNDQRGACRARNGRDAVLCSVRRWPSADRPFSAWEDSRSPPTTAPTTSSSATRPSSSESGSPQSSRHRPHGDQLRFSGFHEHQIRWMKSTRFSRPPATSQLR